MVVDSDEFLFPSRPPFFIGVAGGTASGKSSVCARIMEKLSISHKRQVIALSQDSFYRNLNAEESRRARRGDFNFDHPDAFEATLLLDALNNLKKWRTTQIPKYDFCTNSRLNGCEVIKPADVIIVEGILLFYDRDLRDAFDLKVFVDADSDDRLARRIQRDLRERGRSLNQVLHQYLTLVKPAFEDFCLPTKKYADIVIPRGADNLVAIDLMLHHIHEIVRSPSTSSDSSLENGDCSDSRLLFTRPH